MGSVGRAERMVAGLLVIAMAVVSTGWWGAAAGAQENTVAPVTTLENVEKALYGRIQEGSLVERLNRVETDLYGETKSGALITRIGTISSFLSGGSADQVSLALQTGAVEWMVFQQLSSDRPMIERIKNLEGALLGQQQGGPLVQRVEKLVSLVWPGGKLNLDKVNVPATTLVKVQLLAGVSSDAAEVGQTVPYKVVEDVRVGNRVVIPAGTLAQARVTEVQKAGPLGRAGRIVLDFGVMPAFDGTLIPLGVAKRATTENESLGLAAGASVAGILLLGPIGLVSGYFVQGKNVSIPSGTSFYVEVLQDTTALGLSLSPVSQR
ncbi:MAG: hypothetical protein IMX01_05395 [Limnochordaceae bacterium]|nr:hypothetical protein [Limnochordaceae bacterium]